MARSEKNQAILAVLHMLARISWISRAKLLYRPLRREVIVEIAAIM